MIPKIIHYCWFGGNPLPKSAVKCISSWKKYFPEYEIKEWNEQNFDVNMMPYTQEAYAAKKYAFVSDVARFWILYQEGGVYFDTDVEVIHTFEDILEKGAFMGIEVPSIDGSYPMVASGLGLAVEKGNPFYLQVLEFYNNNHFIDFATQKPLPGTVVTHVSELLKRNGLQPHNDLQQVMDIWIYPQDFFCPLEDATGILRKTKNTRSVHWYSKTWIEKPLWYFTITRVLHRLFGINTLSKFKKNG